MKAYSGIYIKASLSIILMLTFTFAHVTLAINRVLRTNEISLGNIGMMGDFMPQGFNSGDSIIIGNSTNINASKNFLIYAQDLGSFVIKQIDTSAANSFQDVHFIVRNTNLELGSIITSAPLGGFFRLHIAPNSKVTLSSFSEMNLSTNDYSKLDVVNLADDSEFIINSSGTITLPTSFLLPMMDPMPPEPNSRREGGKIIISNGSITTFNGSFYPRQIKEINVDSNSTAIFNTSIFLNKTLNINTGGKVTFGPNTEIGTKIATNHTGDYTSLIIFQGNNKITEDIGSSISKISEIEFKRYQAFELYGNIHAQRINLDDSYIYLGKDVTLDGTLSSDSTNYSLGTNTLNLVNSANSVFKGDVTINFTIEDNKNGKVIVSGGGLDLDKENTLSSLNLNLVDNAYVLPLISSNGQSYTILGTKNIGDQIRFPDNTKVRFNVIQQNPFVAWNYENGVVTRRRIPEEQINQILEEVIKSNGGSQIAVDNAIRLANPNNTHNAASFFQQLTLFVIRNNDDLLKAIKALQPVVTEAAEQVSEVVDQSISSIRNRLNSLANGIKIAQSDGMEGVAAGEDINKYGAWTNVFYNNVRQKPRGESPGFKSQTVGTMFGADTMINPESTVGFALSLADNKVKHTDSNSGDTSKVKTYTLMIYGMQELTDNWLIQGVGLFSRNMINNREHRYIPEGFEIARADFKVDAYSLETSLNYNQLVTEKILMTTTIGAEYIRIGASKYKETGTTNQNLSIKKKADNKLDAILGVSFAYNEVLMDKIIVPEVHGNITYDMLNSSPKVSVYLDGLAGEQLSKKSSQFGRTFYNLGTGLSVEKGCTEFSIGYDLYLGNRYVGHQGAAKIRFNF